MVEFETGHAGILIIVSVTVAVPTGIGAGFRVERRVDRVGVAAEAVDHRFDDVVGTDTDAVAEQLHRQVAIAEMPRDADQLGQPIAA